MKAENKLLIVDDNIDYLKSLSMALGRDFFVLTASSTKEARELLSSRPDLALIDIRLDDADPTNREGMRLLEFIKNEKLELPVVMITAYSDIDIAVEAMKLGAADFVQKGKVDLRELRKVIKNTLERSRLGKKVLQLEEDLHRLEPWELVGNNPKIQEVKNLIDRVAEDGQVTVLIRGDTGTGKELVARAIHSRGMRKEGPFVPVSISALHRDTIESELFGHEKGAFTGATARKLGYIEKANSGVLFLDEIGELGQELQIKLLRFLDHKSFVRMGGTKETNVGLQLVAATNRNLENAVEGGEFRKDFYYRLKTMEIYLPPLVERQEDIPKLACHFLALFRSQGRTKIQRISDGAMELLRSYDWPGNVRELKSCVERAIIYASHKGHNQIVLDDLPHEVRTTTPGKGVEYNEVEIPGKNVDIQEELAKVELAHIEKALRYTGGKKTEAWKLLGYNDRFAMKRRIERIAKKYPNLTDDYPLLGRKYAPKVIQIHR